MPRPRMGVFNKLRQGGVGYKRIREELTEGLVMMEMALPKLVAAADKFKEVTSKKGQYPTDADYQQLDRLMDTIRRMVRTERELEHALGYERKEPE